MAALFRVRPFFLGRGMDDNERIDEKADRIGRLVSSVFIALLAAMFVYGYLGHFVSG
jgi:hypothetical protein